MINPIKSRIFTVPKINNRSTSAVFLMLNRCPEYIVRDLTRPSNSEHKPRCATNVTLRQKNGRRWPLFINSKLKIMPKSNEPTPGTIEHLLAALSRFYTVADNYRKAYEESAHLAANMDVEPEKAGWLSLNYYATADLLEAVEIYEKN